MHASACLLAVTSLNLAFLILSWYQGHTEPLQCFSLLLTMREGRDLGMLLGRLHSVLGPPGLLSAEVQRLPSRVPISMRHPVFSSM